MIEYVVYGLIFFLIVFLMLGSVCITFKPEVDKSKMKKVYISGRINGKTLSEARLDFSLAECSLREKGYDVVNPFDIGECYRASHKKQNIMYEDYMREDIKALVDCDFIYFLKDAEQSKGARFERQVAEFLKIKELKE